MRLPGGGELGVRTFDLAHGAESALSVPCGGPEAWLIPLDDARLLQAARAVLSADERDAANRFATPTLADRFTAARGALRLLLGRWLDRDPRDVRFVRNDYGKPFVPDGPFFNLSHAEGLAAVAVFPDREVGVDIERLAPFSAVRGVAEEFFSPGERAWIAGGTPPEARFFRCWVLREAFVKALGQGLSFPLERFRILTPPGRDVSVAVSDGAAHGVRLTEWRPAEGFVGALAVREGPTCYEEERR